MPNLEDFRDVEPTAARGHNLVIVTPPSPAYAAPALRGVLESLGDGRRGLLLCPAAELDTWGAVAYAAAYAAANAGPSRRVQVAHGTARAMRRLKAGTVDLLIATPDTALALLQRAALKADTLNSLILAGPETWTPSAGSDDPLTPLMQDLPKESQRIIITAAPDRAQALVERYARKALVVGAPGPEDPPVQPAGPVRTVSVPWGQRAPVLADIIEILDPPTCVIWTADESRHEEIGRAVPVGTETQIVTGDAPAAETIIAFDLPTADRLRQLQTAGEVLLLVPPSTETYVDQIASTRRPLRLPGLVDTITTAAGARRAAIVGALEAGNPDRALLTLAPLFERYDPAAVAAALFDLWTAGGGNVPSALPDIPALARVYIGVGKKDGVTVNDIVATLTKDVRVDRTKIGKIELRDAFTLVELPAQEAEAIARALTGTTIRRKRITARIDRGRAAPATGKPRPQTGRGAPAGRPRTPR